MALIQRLVAECIALQDKFAGIAEMKLLPAIFAIAYASLVGSSGPVSSASSVMGCEHSRG